MDFLSTFRLIYLIGAVNALFFSLLVFSKKNKIYADKILGWWLLILFGQLIIPSIYLIDINLYYQFAGFEIAFYVFHPLFLYLYVLATIGEKPTLRYKLWNLILIIISEIIGLSFLIYPAKERLLFIEGKEFLPLFYVPLVFIMVGYFGYNIYASYKTLKNYKENVLQIYSYRENVDLLWLRRLVIMFAAISILAFPLGLVSYYGFHSIVFADYLFFIALVVFIFFLGFWGSQQGAVFNMNGNPTFIGELQHVEIQVVEKHYKKEADLLKRVMMNEKPYLNPSLTIHDLAQLINIPAHVLSKVINREFHNNFFEFVNAYRIKEFQQRAFSSEYKNMTILAVAFDCGFNSKSAFNRIFKDITGITPGVFIKNQKQ